MRKWGFLFEEIRYKDNFFKIYYLIYVFRRLSFVCLAFYVATPTYQRIVVQLTNLLNFWYVGKSPLERRSLNRLEMINESVVCLVCLHLNFFTEWIDDPNVQSMYGWSLILIVSAHMLLQIWIVGCNVVSLLHLLFIRLLIEMAKCLDWLSK